MAQAAAKGKVRAGTIMANARLPILNRRSLDPSIMKCAHDFVPTLSAVVPRETTPTAGCDLASGDKAMLDQGRVASLALPLILAVAVAMRLLGLHFSLWLDESASLAFARQPLSHLWGEWMLRETNPPLFYTLLKGWQSVAGHSDRAVRMLPIAIGLTGVWGMYLLGRTISGARTGLLAASLLAVSAIDVDYSLQLRGYGLAHGGVIFACLGMVRFVQFRRLNSLLLYLCGATVALYGHTTLAVFVALSNCAMIILLRRDRVALIAWLVANIGLALAWAWWAWITIRQLGMPHNFGWITKPSILDAWQITSEAFVPLYLRSATLGGGLILSAILGGVGLFAVRRARPETTLLAALALGAPLALFAISQRTPILLPRTLFWASGPLLALVAAAVLAIPDRRSCALVSAVLLVLSCVGLFSWLPFGETEQWRGAALALQRIHGARDILVTDDSVALALAHYLPDARERVVVVDDSSNDHESWALGLFDGRHMRQVDAARLFKKECRVISIRRGNYDPSALLRAVGGRPTRIPIGAANPQLAVWDCEAARAAR